MAPRALTRRRAAGGQGAWKEVAAAFKDAGVSEAEGVGLAPATCRKAEGVGLAGFLQIAGDVRRRAAAAGRAVAFTDAQAERVFHETVAALGRAPARGDARGAGAEEGRVSLGDLRKMVEFNSRGWLEEVAPVVLQRQRRRWVRARALWERPEGAMDKRGEWVVPPWRAAFDQLFGLTWGHGAREAQDQGSFQGALGPAGGEAGPAGGAAAEEQAGQPEAPVGAAPGAPQRAPSAARIARASSRGLARRASSEAGAGRRGEADAEGVGEEAEGSGEGADGRAEEGGEGAQVVSEREAWREAELDALLAPARAAKYAEMRAGPPLEVEGRGVEVWWDAAGEPRKVVWVEGREELLLQVWGWEWDVRRVVVEGSEEVLWEALAGEQDAAGGGAAAAGGGDADDVAVADEAAREARGAARAGHVRALLRLLEESEAAEGGEEAAAGEEGDDSSDSDEEEEGGAGEGQAAGGKEEQVKAEILRLLNAGEAREWGEAHRMAEDNIFRRAFAEVDADGSGRVDAEEVSAALHRIGLAATGADVAAMMAAADPGGLLRAVRAEIAVLHQLRGMLELGLKESDAARLTALEAREKKLAEALDIDAEWNLGFAAYVRMVNKPPPPPPPRTNRTSLVPPLVLSGHAASLTPYR